MWTFTYYPSMMISIYWFSKLWIPNKNTSLDNVDSNVIHFVCSSFLDIFYDILGASSLRPRSIFVPSVFDKSIDSFIVFLESDRGTCSLCPYRKGQFLECRVYDTTERMGWAPLPDSIQLFMGTPTF